MKPDGSGAGSPVDIIIGAGPAGLTAAYELLEAGRPPPLIVEADSQVGGISKTIDHHGNRMDLGGHRFFSKSDWVMNWWQNILPVATDEESLQLGYQNATRTLKPTITRNFSDEKAFMVRPRLSRIYYGRRFYDYPVRLNANTIVNLGLPRMARIGAGYAWAQLHPRRPEATLEDFLINRFGVELYRTFFRDYTEKVWGVSCRAISAEWGAQRIKGLSVGKALRHALGTLLRTGDRGGIRQKATETSLIERFLYPVLGPGQLWEEVASRVQARGATLWLRHRVVALHRADGRIVGADIENQETHERIQVRVGEVISTMPIKELAEGLAPAAPEAVLEIARRIPYRDFITVGLLVERMRVPARSGPAADNGMPPDNWIYIQEPDVALGRLQIFNNWSPAMVASHPSIWLGLEYFCNQGDELWSLSDGAFAEFAAGELAKIGLVDTGAVLDARIVRVPKAYPAYFGAYARIGEVKAYFDTIPNLFLVGRNGMHRYNNQDHSMLAAREAVKAIVAGSREKSSIWAVNADTEYHEHK